MRREVDRVLVRDVDARDRDRAVVVHLLDELPRQLDRLHVRPEGTTEHALDECFDLLFDRAENAQRAVSRPFESTGGPRLPGAGASCRDGGHRLDWLSGVGLGAASPHVRLAASARPVAAGGEDGDARAACGAATSVSRPTTNRRSPAGRRAARGRGRRAGRLRRAPSAPAVDEGRDARTRPDDGDAAARRAG